MEVRRTVPVKLDVADSDADLLHETIQQFLDAANYVVEAAYDGERVEIRSAQPDGVAQQPRSVSA